MTPISLRRRLAGSGGWAIAARLGTIMFGLALNMLLTRLLEPEAFGTYVLVLTVTGIAALLGQLGASQAVLRIVAGLLSRGQHSLARSVVVKATLLAAAGLCAASVVVIALGRWAGVELLDSERIARVAGWMGVITLVSGLQAMLSETYRAYQDMRSAAVYGGVLSAALLLSAMAIMFVSGIGVTLSDVLMWFVIAYASALLIGAGRMLTRLGRATPGETFGSIGLLKVAMPLALTSAVTVLFQLDTWILGTFRSESEVAAYGIATRLAFVVSAPLMVINYAIAPFIAELHAQNETAKLERVLRSAATAATLPAALIFLGIVVWNEELLRTLFGDFYTTGGLPLILLSLAQFVTAWTGSCGTVLMMVGRQRLLVGISLAAGVSLIGVSIALAADFGATGVATGYLVGTTVLNVGAWLLVKKSIGLYSHAYTVPTRDLLADLRRLASWPIR